MNYFIENNIIGSAYSHVKDYYNFIKETCNGLKLDGAHTAVIFVLDMKLFYFIFRMNYIFIIF